MMISRDFCLLLVIALTSKSFANKGNTDRELMHRAIRLASQAQGMASPNPCVGCVIVDSNGRIVGEGYHQKAGFPHAEAEALKICGDLARNGTAYVSLEPCSHYGRTPPCAKALLQVGVARVVTGMVDPDSRVSGRGIRMLREHGVQVDVGVEGHLCKELNEPFVYRVITKRPYAVYWTSTINKSPNMNTLISAWNSVAKEVDTVLLSASIDIERLKILTKLPSHIRFVFCDETQNSGDRIVTSIKSVGEVLSYQGFSPTLDQAIPFLTSEGRSVFIATSGASHNEASLVSEHSFLKVLRMAATIGCNAALILYEGSFDKLRKLCAQGYVQKVIVSSDVSIANDEQQYPDDSEKNEIFQNLAQLSDAYSSGAAESSASVTQANHFDEGRLVVFESHDGSNTYSAEPSNDNCRRSRHPFKKTCQTYSYKIWKYRV